MKRLLLLVFVLAVLQGCIIDTFPPPIVVSNSTSNAVNVEVRYKGKKRYVDEKMQAELVKVDSTNRIYYFLVKPGGRLILETTFPEDGFYFDKISYYVHEKKYTLDERKIKKIFTKSNDYEYVIKD